MEIKLILALIATVFNILLGIKIVFKMSKDPIKDKAKIYFSIMCFLASLWSISVAGTFISKNPDIYILITNFSYFFAMFIFPTFLLFSINFIYKIKYSLFLKIIMLYTLCMSIILSFLIFSNKLIYDYSIFNFGIHSIENKGILLIYGVFIISILVFCYTILFNKYIKSVGINKRIILIIILGTIIPFTIGVTFDWFAIYINKYSIDRISPIFTIFMNLSIAYLLFKKD